MWAEGTKHYWLTLNYADREGDVARDRMIRLDREKEWRFVEDDKLAGTFFAVAPTKDGVRYTFYLRNAETRHVWERMVVRYVNTAVRIEVTPKDVLPIEMVPPAR